MLISWRQLVAIILAWLGVLFLVQLAHLEHAHGATVTDGPMQWEVAPTDAPMPRCRWGWWVRGPEGRVFVRHMYGRFLEYPVCAQDEGVSLSDVEVETEQQE